MCTCRGERESRKDARTCGTGSKGKIGASTERDREQRPWWVKGQPGGGDGAAPAAAAPSDAPPARPQLSAHAPGALGPGKRPRMTRPPPPVLAPHLPQPLHEDALVAAAVQAPALQLGPQVDDSQLAQPPSFGFRAESRGPAEGCEVPQPGRRLTLRHQGPFDAPPQARTHGRTQHNHSPALRSRHKMVGRPGRAEGRWGGGPRAAHARRGAR